MKMNNKNIKKYINYEILMPILLVIFVLIYLWDVSDLSRVAKRTPILFGIFTFSFLIIQLYLSFKKVKSDNYDTSKKIDIKNLGKNKLLRLLILMFLYSIGLYYIGYMLSTIIIMSLTIWVLGEKNLKRVIFVTAGYMIIFYLVFVKIFGLQPPQGLW